MSSEGGSAVTSARLRLHGRRGTRNISARPAAELPRLAGPAAAVQPSGADVSAEPAGARYPPPPPARPQTLLGTAGAEAHHAVAAGGCCCVGT
ncbi:hypothetical protein Ae168Ps1_6454c [Pseudonocardia sp. Ae168_Ps1]|nr:hypothetical protein Ae168Ps1_6454c [Pseudonocardia sp. Ae168_Ps1]OLL69811.1 hypothetical protein Ae150APs1_6273c [Pseudonocardia sp. Ae150A_Ps1]OLL69936.1 hypothetical protein Ae263Ps1_6404c [Pseudonocardia sp. Ae263_Ps1]